MLHALAINEPNGIRRHCRELKSSAVSYFLLGNCKFYPISIPLLNIMHFIWLRGRLDIIIIIMS